MVESIELAEGNAFGYPIRRFPKTPGK